jgi:hypothetical protein
MLTDGPLIRLCHLLPQGEKALTAVARRVAGKETEIPAFAGMTRWAKVALVAAVLAASAGAVPTAVQAETIANPVAAFSGLDKITGRITKFDVYINETVLFGYADAAPSADQQGDAVLAGALVITPRVCYTRPPTEAQRTSVFLEVDRVGEDGKAKRIFTGWMFADSPALNAIDDPVYDVWLDGCKASTDVPPQQQAAPAQPAQTPAPSAPAATQAQQQPAAPAQTPAPAAPNATAQVFDDRG